MGRVQRASTVGHRARVAIFMATLELLLLLAPCALGLDIIDSDRDSTMAAEVEEYCHKIDIGVLHANEVAEENWYTTMKAYFKDSLICCVLSSRLDGVMDSRHWDVNAGGDPSIQGFAKVQFGSRCLIVVSLLFIA